MFPTAEDQLAMMDVLHRFAAGQDLKDPDLFRSAFTADATLDFSQPALSMGLHLPAFVGLERIADAVLGSTGPLDTTHTVSNVRVLSFEGDVAGVYALVEAQHVSRDDRTRHLLLKNHYHLELVRQGRGWGARSMIIENVWSTGDPAVLFPPGEG